MFTTLIQKIVLGFYIFLIISIPIGAYVVASRQESQNTKTSASEVKPVTKPLPSLAPAEQLKQLSEKKATTSTTPTPEEEEETLSTALSFGPTMNLKLILEGRP